MQKYYTTEKVNSFQGAENQYQWPVNAHRITLGPLQDHHILPKWKIFVKSSPNPNMSLKSITYPILMQIFFSSLVMDIMYDATPNLMMNYLEWFRSIWLDLVTTAVT